MALPRKPNRQPSQNFADIISQRAQEVRAQPHGQEILRMQSPEQIAEFMSPMMMGVGNLTNITGRGLPQIISKATKSYAQTVPTPANPRQIQGVKWEQILGNKSSPNQALKELMRQNPKKVKRVYNKLARHKMEIIPSTYHYSGSGVTMPVLKIVKHIKGGAEEIAIIHRDSQGRFFINSPRIKDYLSTRARDFLEDSGHLADIGNYSLDGLLDILDQNLM